jgi:hypothetical protein
VSVDERHGYSPAFRARIARAVPPPPIALVGDPAPQRRSGAPVRGFFGIKEGVFLRR